MTNNNNEYQDKVLRFLYAKSVEDNIFIQSLENAIRRHTQQQLEEYSQMCKRYRSTIEIQAEILYRQLQPKILPQPIQPNAQPIKGTQARNIKKQRVRDNNPYKQYNEQNLHKHHQLLIQRRQSNTEVPTVVNNTQNNQPKNQQEAQEALGI